MTSLLQGDDVEYQTLSFPLKLHAMLEDSLILGFEDIVTWQPGGKSFKVFQPGRFQTEILGEYFNHTTYKSFQRQLNLYGFQRVQTGPNKGGYIHKLFSEGNVAQCKEMHRKQNKSPTWSSKTIANNHNSQNDQVAPNFLRSTIMENVSFNSSPIIHSLNRYEDKVDISGLDVEPFYSSFFPDDSKPKTTTSPSFQDDLNKETAQLKQAHDSFSSTNATTPLFFSSASATQQPNDDETLLDINRLIESSHFNDFLPVSADFTMDNIDFSSVCFHEDEDELEQLPSFQQEKHESSFPWKLHLMLENAENENYNHVVSWIKDGSAFKVHDSKAFVEQVLPNYFDQTKYESFRRQLNLYGFKRVSKGADRGILSHESFRQGARWRCREIVSKSHS